MAKISESIASEFGEVEHMDSENSGEMKALADTAVTAGGDCCAPRK